jgi:hypothetical protein
MTDKEKPATGAGQPCIGKRQATLPQDQPKCKQLPRGNHPGFSNLKSQPGVYRCKLWPDINKRDPNQADYKGVLPLTGSKASILIWVHDDGSLGLRLEKITAAQKPIGGAV